MFCRYSLIFCGIVCSILLHSSPKERHQRYLDFVSKHFLTKESGGSYRQGEIEIVRGEKEIREIEEMRKAQLLQKGYSKERAQEASRIGIVSEDEYWYWVRDGVIFPTGAKGTYNRIIWKGEMYDQAPRVAMIPIMEDGKIVLNLNYRHGLRKWVLEVPRGFKCEGECDQETMRRQLRDETGYELGNTQYLGSVSPDSGSLSMRVPIYLVHVGKKCISNQDYSEAILRVESLTLDEIKKALVDEEVTLEIKGKKEKVGICDAFLAYGLLQAETKGLFERKS